MLSTHDITTSISNAEQHKFCFHSNGERRSKCKRGAASLSGGVEFNPVKQFIQSFHSDTAGMFYKK